ncbi:MAG: HNH endonuclease [Microbacteriaceae bacterium]|nr:MAG: HNH endonuclease [Microbacteriaceae bacterium]
MPQQCVPKRTRSLRQVRESSQDVRTASSATAVWLHAWVNGRPWMWSNRSPGPHAWRRLGEAMGQADVATRLIDAAEQSPTMDEPSLAGALEVPNGESPDADPGAESAVGSAVELPWFEPITRAVSERVVTAQAAEAMIRGLGQPCERCDSEVLRAAAEELLADAAGMNADALAKQARWLRDRLDSVGVTERAERRYAARKWRFSRNADGARTAWVEFDDESAAWMDTIVSAGMRPRRGGPRFVDKAEAEAAQKLQDDPRTNDQLVFDLLMDVLRAGATADPSTGFGSRQPGLRVVITKSELDKHDADSNLTGTGYLEETGEAVPPAMIERLLCDVGTREVTVDQDGNPLDVGREQRLFTAKQRVALAIRDGGCMHPGCDRPPSYTEAHHIDEWAADHGKTDGDCQRNGGSGTGLTERKGNGPDDRDDRSCDGRAY